MSKKVESLVKGIAITGAAVGGSSVFSDANLVYASTSESLDVSNAPELVVNLEAKPMENVISAPASTTNVVAEPAATVLTSPVPQAEPEVQTDPEVQVEPEIQTDPEVQVEPELQADSESTPTDEELFASASESLSTEDSELGSTSEFQSESLENTVSSLSQAESETASEYTSTSTAYSEANYDVEGLDELEDDVNEKLEREVEVRTSIENNNQLLTSNNYYNAERDDLAIAMIRYKLVQSGEITADYTISNAIDLGKNTNYLTNT
ncbi:MAG: hypothetical protein K6E79_05800, partial [Pseudobutyrivibrio sp.]|nr:hypothetical protein [Pseudobutyrivibrio sp.]